MSAVWGDVWGAGAWADVWGAGVSATPVATENLGSMGPNQQPRRRARRMVLPTATSFAQIEEERAAALRRVHDEEEALFIVGAL